MNNELYDIVADICLELGIKYDLLSEGWIIKLNKDNVTRFIAGYKFDLNDHALGLVLDDKYALYETLSRCNVNIIKHDIVYGESNKNLYAKNLNTLDYVVSLFHKYNDDVVLKVNNGTCGNNVYHVTDVLELERVYKKISTKDNSLSICPYYDIINEYRSIILDGNIELMYKKEKPVVIGDGVKSIKDLLMDFNYHYFKNIDDSSLDRILDKDEEYIYDWKFNLSRGARMSEEIADEDRTEIVKVVNDVLSNLDIGFGSIDVIKTYEGYYVLEINSGVMMKNFINEAVMGKKRAYDIYRKAIKKMFDIK